MDMWIYIDKKRVSLNVTPSKYKPWRRKVHSVSLWPWPLTSDLENIFSNDHLHDAYLCQVSLKSLG